MSLENRRKNEVIWNQEWEKTTLGKKTESYPLGDAAYDSQLNPSLGEYENQKKHLFWIRDSNLRNTRFELENSEDFAFFFIKEWEHRAVDFITPLRKLSLKLARVHHVYIASKAQLGLEKLSSSQEIHMIRDIKDPRHLLGEIKKINAESFVVRTHDYDGNHFKLIKMGFEIVGIWQEFEVEKNAP